VDERIRTDKRFGFTVSSDGYSDTSQLSLSNIMINTISGAFFHGNMEMGIREKNAEAVAEVFEPLFEEFGRAITAVVTDSAPVS
jgi:hypothetical protein